MVQTQSQLYAQRAYQKVTCVKGRGAEKEAKYRTVALSFPSLVHTCGLAQAIAFVEVKGKNSGFSEHLDYVLFEIERKETDEESLVAEKSRTNDLLDYMQLSRQVMTASGWLKRYAEAMLKSEKKE